MIRYRWWIIFTALAVTTLVTLWTFRLPKVYQATVTLEYDPNPTSPLGSSVEDVGGQVSHFLMSREFFETQNLIIQSRAVAERVVEHLGLADDPTFFGQERGTDWAPVAKEVAAQRLQSRLTLDPIKDTRLVRLEVRDTDPERAATLANMVASAYIEKTMEDRLGSTAAAAEWLAQQLDSTRTTAQRVRARSARIQEAAQCAFGFGRESSESPVRRDSRIQRAANRHQGAAHRARGQARAFEGRTRPSGSRSRQQWRRG